MDAETRGRVTLPELLAEYGAENLRFQVLSNSLDGQQATRAKDNTTRFSFRSETTLDAVMRQDVEAFIVWMDKGAMRAAMDRCKARRLSGSEGMALSDRAASPEGG